MYKYNIWNSLKNNLLIWSWYQHKVVSAYLTWKFIVIYKEISVWWFVAGCEFNTRVHNEQSTFTTLTPIPLHPPPTHPPPLLNSTTPPPLSHTSIAPFLNFLHHLNFQQLTLQVVPEGPTNGFDPPWESRAFAGNTYCQASVLGSFDSTEDP